MKIIVLNLPRAKVYRGSEPYVVISIGDHGQDLPDFIEDNYRRDILRVEFSDEIYADISDAITQRQAEDILDFVDKYHESVETLMIHCQAGHSRSQGIGVALATIYKTKRVDGPTTEPNCLVVARLLKEWEKRTQEIIEPPKIYRGRLSCKIHPNEHLYPDKDENGNLFGYCMNCKKIIKAHSIDLFGDWSSESKLSQI